jgi:hypothetical protein
VVKKGIRIGANAFYAMCVALCLITLLFGLWANFNFNSKETSAFLQYGAAIHKYPLVNRYVLAKTDDSPLSDAMRSNGPWFTRLHAIDNCEASKFSTMDEFFACANVGQAESVTVVLDVWGDIQSFEVVKGETATPFKPDIKYMLVDSVLLLLSLGFSLLLFAKGRRFVSGYLISLLLLITVCESRFFYIGSSMFGATDIETLRLSLAFIFGPLGLYYFPKTFDNKVWKRIQLSLVAFSSLLLFITYSLTFTTVANAWSYFLYAVSFTLLVTVVQFVLKYRMVLNTQERKQTITMLFCVLIALVLYLPLFSLSGYGTLVGRYLLGLSVGVGVFIALMRYGLWQVDSIISKSATLSLLSVVAFSLWAGLDQGMQALLNQTIGLSNNTVTAFLAAVISSLFAIPAYNFVSRSCDAFFNKDLHLLKRFLSKDILVLAETQKLETFVEQVGQKLLVLSGARKIHLTFNDFNRLPAPIEYTDSVDKKSNEYVVKNESFEYHIDNILSLTFSLEYVDRRINKEIKNELEEGTDEIARALASCTRWNYLESLDPSKAALRPASST